MRVSVDQNMCMGAGQCVLLAPDVFDQDDDGVVVVLQQEPPADTHEDVHQAALTCPNQLITLLD